MKLHGHLSTNNTQGLHLSACWHVNSLSLFTLHIGTRRRGDHGRTGAFAAAQASGGRDGWDHERYFFLVSASVGDMNPT
jgi:hypothetical protein